MTEPADRQHAAVDLFRAHHPPVLDYGHRQLEDPGWTSKCDSCDWGITESEEKMAIQVEYRRDEHSISVLREFFTRTEETR